MRPAVGSPYAQVSSPAALSPSLSQAFPQVYSPTSGYLHPHSPLIASPASYYTSFSQVSSPARRSTASFPSMSQGSSPTVPVRPYIESPTRVPLPVMESPRAPVPNRIPLPQSIKPCPNREAQAVDFKCHGVKGIPMREVLKGRANGMLDGHDDRVLEQTGVRQIRLVIDVSTFSQHTL